MHDIKQMYASDKKMHQLPSKNTKIPSKEHMPDIEKKKPPFTVSDTNILAKYQITFSQQKRLTLSVNDINMCSGGWISIKKWKRGGFNFHNTTQDIIAFPSFRKYVEEYHAPILIGAWKIFRSNINLLYNLQVNKNELKVEKKQEINLEKLFRIKDHKFKY